MKKFAPVLTLFALLGAPILLHSQTDGTAIPLENAGFEEPYTLVPPANPEKKAQITGLQAEGWHDNSDWADISVEYSKEAENPHGGQASQKVDVTRVHGGAVQVTQKVPFQANHQYLFRVWLRGTPGTSVSIQLRRAEDPYTTYAMTDARLSDEWNEFTVSGGVSDDTPGFVLLLAGRPMTLWIDDASLEDITGSTPAPAAP